MPANHKIPHTQQTKEILRLKALERWKIPTWNEEKRREKLKISHLGIPLSKFHKEQISKALKNKPKSEKQKIKISETKKFLLKEGKIIHPKGMLGKHHTKKTKKKISEKLKGKKLSKEHIEKILKRLKDRPTSIEKQFIEIIQKNNLPFVYCGDGSLLIGYKNPDFYEINGKKICIEVANHYHHQGDWAERRIEHFAKFGWKCLVFFCNRNGTKFESTEKEIQEVILSNN